MDALSSPCQDASIFPFLELTHPFYSQIRGFKQYIHNTDAYHQMVARQAAGLPISIHAEIKTKVIDDGRQIDRFYYSIQFPNPALPGGWYSWSLHYSEKMGAPREYEFPYDPKLTHLADFVHLPENAGIKVLRYVPLRRVTFFKPGHEGLPDLIGKLKKPNRAKDGYLRLANMNTLSSSFSFSVPKAVSINTDQAVFYQSLAPGAEVTHLFNDKNYLELMTEIGNLHGELGKSPIAENNRWDRDGVKDNLWHDLDEIEFYLPETTVFIEKLRVWLRNRQQKLSQVSDTFCHGDFACPQILRAENGLSVVDFDLAGMGNPCQDMAMFMVSLSYDVPLFEKRQDLLKSAQTAYLEGYQNTNDMPIDMETLVWYLVCAEIYYVALVLKKDRYVQTAYDAAQNRLYQLIHS